MADSIVIVISRSEAKAQGLNRYFTGVPCNRGHVSARYTGSCMCVACSGENNLSQKGQRPKTEKTEGEKQRAAEHSKKYHHKNREVVLAAMKVRNRAYYLKNKEKIIAAAGKYQSENLTKRNAYKSAWSTQRAKKDPVFSAALMMRKLASRACDRIKSGRKERARTAEKLGYTASELKAHIERQFLPGMTWANHGAWHLDHVLPIASFDLTCPLERMAVNGLGNLRPLWAKDNLKKSDSLHTLL